MPQTKRACPLCAAVTDNPVCDRHGKNVTILTLTLAQLQKRLARYRGEAVGIQNAIKALQAEAVKC